MTASPLHPMAAQRTGAVTLELLNRKFPRNRIVY